MTEEATKKKRRWKYQIDLGLLSLFVWSACIFFFIAWIFVLGIFVGRGYMPGKISDLSGLQGEITKMHDTLESKATEETKKPVSSGFSEKEPELEFYDQLTTKKEEARINFQDDPVPETPKSSPVTVPLKEHITSQQTVNESRPQAQTAETAANDNKAPVQETAAPASDKKTVSPPPVAAAKTGSGKYTIQLAAIAERAKAEKTVKQLIEKGFDAYYYETKVKNKTLYRIRCGRFTDRADAVKTALKLQNKTGFKGYVTGAE